MWEQLETLVKSWINSRFENQEVDNEAWNELEDYLRRAPDPGNSGPSRYAPAARSASDIPQKIRQAYFDLELTPGAPHEEIRTAYRRLLRAYHPDRFHNDPERAKKATEIIHRVTLAYKQLNDYYRT